MRIVVAVITFMLLGLPAHSQQEFLKDNTKEEQAKKDLERARRDAEINRQYNATVRATGSTKAAKTDPWGGVREAPPPAPR